MYWLCWENHSPVRGWLQAPWRTINNMVNPNPLLRTTLRSKPNAFIPWKISSQQGPLTMRLGLTKGVNLNVHGDHIVVQHQFLNPPPSIGWRSFCIKEKLFWGECARCTSRQCFENWIWVHHIIYTSPLSSYLTFQPWNNFRNIIFVSMKKIDYQSSNDVYLQTRVVENIFLWTWK